MKLIRLLFMFCIIIWLKNVAKLLFFTTQVSTQIGYPMFSTDPPLVMQETNLKIQLAIM